MIYRVRVLLLAQYDVEEIIDYLFPRSAEGAASWHKAWKSMIERVGRNPRAYGAGLEVNRIPYELRQATFKTRRGRKYRALFTIVGDEVRIIRVRAPGQRPLTAAEMPLSP